MSFNELGLSPHILRAVKELGYEQPTPIQQQAIPAILAGQALEGGHIGSLIQVTAFMIVIIGSLGATMVATMPSDLPFAIQAFTETFIDDQKR